MKKIKREKSVFTKWLKNKNLSVQRFCLKCVPPLDYNTATSWKDGHEPREFTKVTLQKQWPDCPLFK